MIIEKYIYRGYTIEIYENKIYQNWSYVIKKNENIVKQPNKIYFSLFDVKNSAELAVNLLENE